MTRTLWIEFYNRTERALGTDGTQRLDGRLGLRSAIQEGYARAYNLRRVQAYTNFRIMRGSRPSQLVPVTGLIELPTYEELVR